MNQPGLTIGRLARVAEVGVETIRYYQRQNLLPMPNPGDGAFRHYPAEIVERIRFIKRAQTLGFTLKEIGTLLLLEDGTDRHAIRTLADDRLGQVRSKIVDLQRMEKVLAQLIHSCESTAQVQPCP